MSISGDRFEELYQEFWPLAYALCRSRLGDHEAALDAAQEVFVRKWGAIHRYDPARASFRTWLCRNAENHCVDLLRARGRRPGEDPLPEDSDVRLQAPASGGAMVDHAVIGECLALLPAEIRQLVLMHEVEEYTWEEMASITGLTVSQVRTRTAKGMAVLRGLLVENGF